MFLLLYSRTEFAQFINFPLKIDFLFYISSIIQLVVQRFKKPIVFLKFFIKFLHLVFKFANYIIISTVALLLIIYFSSFLEF